MLQVLINALIAACGYFLLGASFGLIYSTAGFFHFAHGAVFVLGAYLAYVLVQVGGLSLPIGGMLAVALATAVGCALELAIYRPLRRRGATPPILLLASLGAYMCIQNGISLVFGDGTLSLRGAGISPSISLWGAWLTHYQLWTLAASVAVLCGLLTLLYGTRVGLTLRAVGRDRSLAAACGLDTDRAVLAAFALGSAIAGTAGILRALDTDFTPLFGIDTLMMGVVAAILAGGGGNIAGLVGSVFALALAQHFGAWFLGSYWQEAVGFLILLGVLLVRGGGALGQWPERGGR